MAFPARDGQRRPTAGPLYRKKRRRTPTRCPANFTLARLHPPCRMRDLGDLDSATKTFTLRVVACSEQPRSYCCYVVQWQVATLTQRVIARPEAHSPTRSTGTRFVTGSPPPHPIQACPGNSQASQHDFARGGDSHNRACFGLFAGHFRDSWHGESCHCFQHRLQALSVCLLPAQPPNGETG